jgi:fatty-acyl-CoA synthase
VAEAAAVGLPHPVWGERPVLVVVMRPGKAPDREGVMRLMEARFARWQLPDDVLFREEIPHTATGKISKLVLRQRLAAEGFALAG